MHVNSCPEMLIYTLFKPVLTGRPAVCTYATLIWWSCSATFVFSPVWFYTSVSLWDADVLLVFADETKDLIHSSRRVSTVLIRRMFTLRIRGSTKMESTPTNPIITFTPRPGKPHCRHPLWLLYCESTWSSVLNVWAIPLFVLWCPCPPLSVDKHSGEMRTKSPWWRADICPPFQEHALWTVQLLSVFSGSTHCARSDTDITGFIGSGGAESAGTGSCPQLSPLLLTPCFFLCVLAVRARARRRRCRPMLEVRRSSRSRRRDR